ncbi:undecaprenyl-phosphate glucose phosphotransferase [Ferrimonas aestuarii]|uniref:Undecaprenyl-phosphate glucose phosphotransferase n=1 Tax=Ferrimonas aestuarii TaxID=2569539 RepID=A0A4U1BL43_9GAMM|nr:undecaprenyl-phosphate glucose phosphotransferase [Ferrimonas aestuarii]TKB51975.1 undecaprenyl-phosphate glucose phosphotransferase [Ferrimonas aestuarii]
MSDSINSGRNHQSAVHPQSHGFALLFRLADICIVHLGFQLALKLAGAQIAAHEMLVTIMGIAGYLFFAESLALYRSWRSTRFKELITTNIAAWLLTIVWLMVCASVVPERVPLTESILVYWLFVGAAMLVLLRLFSRQAIFSLRRRGFNVQTAAILGITRSGIALAKNLEENPQLGIRLVGFFDDRAPERIEVEDEQGKALLGNVDYAIKLAKSGALDVLYIAMPMRAEKRINEILIDCSDSTAAIHILPDFFIYNLLHARWHEVGEIQTLSVYDFPLDGLSSWLKRVEDIALSCAILTLVSIPMLLISIGIKLTSPGPVLFKQYRYGLDGRKIMVWKFRTMNTMENGTKVVQATKDDPRVTRFGALLRKTSLDELPQFFNVLQGQMSVVGPRPHAVAHNEEYRSLINGYMLRHYMKPGITGWAQVNGWRGETDTLEKMEKRLEFDLAYIRNWSVWLDLRIVFKTIRQGFTGANAY